MKLHLLARSYKGGKFETVWLIATDGAAEFSLLHGELLPGGAATLADKLGLRVVYEHLALTAAPKCVPGCVPVHEQGSLFSEKP